MACGDLAMKAPRPPKKKMEAPAYMAQYAALMTILLSFFILLLTMGQEQTAEFKDGLGLIQNAVGSAGGTGVLAFWRTIRNPGLPLTLTEKDDQDDAMLIGYEQEAFDRLLLSHEHINQVEYRDHKKTLLLRSSIRFEPGRTAIQSDAQFALDQAAAMLYTLSSYQVTVTAISHGSSPESSRLLAARQAAWLARHFSEQIPALKNRIRSLGIAEPLSQETEEKRTEVVFLLKKQ
jgi:hypothetical protein